MKRFFLFILLLCTFIFVEAHVCKISDSNDNVEVFSASIVDGSRVEVTVGNDSQDISANVTVEVVVVYESLHFQLIPIYPPKRKGEVSNLSLVFNLSYLAFQLSDNSRRVSIPAVIFKLMKSNFQSQQFICININHFLLPSS